MLKGGHRIPLFPFFLLVSASLHLPLPPFYPLPIPHPLQMSGNVLGSRTTWRRLCLLLVLVGLYVVSGKSAAMPLRLSSETALDDLNNSTGLALRPPVGGTTALEARREGTVHQVW